MSAGVVNGRAVLFPQPAYPARAKSLGRSSIGINVIVNPEGEVISAWVAAGHPLLRQAALAAARRARFEPYKLSGVAVKMQGVLVFAFDPADAGKPPVTIVEGGVLNSKAITLPTPAYPLAAREAGVTGPVEVQVLVDSDGNVIDAFAVTGDKRLWEAAVSAAKQAKLSPNRLGGEPVQVEGRLVVSFADAANPGQQPNLNSPGPIDGGILNENAISLPLPVFPAVAKAAHASGSVTVRVIVDEAGKVVEATAISGHPLLRASALAAARKATFAPVQLNGSPVKVSGVLLYEFIYD